MTTVVYQAYGGENIHRQAAFSILALAGALGKDRSSLRVVVCTDRPAFFEGLGVTVEVLSPATIRAWRGRYDFVHRLKIKALEHCADRYDGDILYFDTDTYVRSSPVLLVSAVREDASLMYRSEGVVGPDNHPVLHRYLVRNAAALGMHSAADITMWNAGVIGIHRRNVGLIREVLTLTDRMTEGCSRHTVEKLAFSYLLQTRTVVTAAEPSVVHYCEVRNGVDEEIARFLHDTAEASFAARCRAAFVLDPASRVKPPVATFGDLVEQYFLRVGGSITRRARRLGHKLVGKAPHG